MLVEMQDSAGTMENSIETPQIKIELLHDTAITSEKSITKRIEISISKRY